MRQPRPMRKPAPEAALKSIMELADSYLEGNETARVEIAFKIYEIARAELQVIANEAMLQETIADMKSIRSAKF